jgi:hypothetical protein
MCDLKNREHGQREPEAPVTWRERPAPVRAHPVRRIALRDMCPKGGCAAWYVIRDGLGSPSYGREVRPKKSRTRAAGARASRHVAGASRSRARSSGPSHCVTRHVLERRMRGVKCHPRRTKKSVVRQRCATSKIANTGSGSQRLPSRGGPIKRVRPEWHCRRVSARRLPRTIAVNFVNFSPAKLLF